MRRLLVATVAVVASVVPASRSAASTQPGLMVRPGQPVTHSYPPLTGAYDNDLTSGTYETPTCRTPGPCDLIPTTLEGITRTTGADVVVRFSVSWEDPTGTDRLNVNIFDPAREATLDPPVMTGPKASGNRVDVLLPDPTLARYDLEVDNVVGVNSGYSVTVTVEQVSLTMPGSGAASGANQARVLSASSGRTARPVQPGSVQPASAIGTSNPLPVDDRLQAIRPLQMRGVPASLSRTLPLVVVVLAFLALGLVAFRLSSTRFATGAPIRVRLSSWFSDLRLFWKLLVPFVAVILVIGAVGAYLTVHYLSSRAATTLDQSLLQRSVGAADYLRDEELYLLEAERFAANLQGVPEATAAHDQGTLARALASAVAVNKGLDVLAATDAGGTGLVDYTPNGASFAAHAGVDWAPAPAVHDVLGAISDASGDKHTSFVRLGDGSVLFLTAGPIRTTGVVGAAVAGISAQKLATGAASRARARVSLYDLSGELMAASGPKTGPRKLSAPLLGSSSVRQRVNGDATLYSPLVIRGARVGTVATTVPVGSAFSAVRGAAYRLGLIVALAMLATIALGMALSRYILRALDPLVKTNRALEAGDLSARAPVLGGDELGEVAAGVNRMAASLEESYANLEAKVQARTAEVQRLLQERTDFFTAVSHEFRTPLAVILGQAKMLGDANVEKKVAWQAQSAAVLTDAGTQLLGFVNDILEIAKVDSGRSELRFTNVAVGDVLGDLRPTIGALAERNSVALKVHVARRLATVRADEARLHHVVLNLVDNAIKYTPPGGSVAVAVRNEGSHVALEVADTGVGIPPEEAGRLFEPFYRVKGNETQGGQPSSGLGLALVKGLVDAMGGQISFQSQVGGGSTFTVRLPTSASTDNDTEEVGDAPSGSLREAAR